MGGCRALRCDQLQDFSKGEWPGLGLGCSRFDRSCQVTWRKGIGRCSDSRAEGDRGWQGLPGSCGGRGVTGRCGGVGEEGREASGIIVVIGTSAVNEGSGDRRIVRGEGFRGNGRARERLMGQGWALFWVA